MPRSTTSPSKLALCLQQIEDRVVLLDGINMLTPEQCLEIRKGCNELLENSINWYGFRSFLVPQWKIGLFTESFLEELTAATKEAREQEKAAEAATRKAVKDHHPAAGAPQATWSTIKHDAPFDSMMDPKLKAAVEDGRVTITSTHGADFSADAKYLEEMLIDPETWHFATHGVNDVIAHTHSAPAHHTLSPGLRMPLPADVFIMRTGPNDFNLRMEDQDSHNQIWTPMSGRYFAEMHITQLFSEEVAVSKKRKAESDALCAAAAKRSCVPRQLDPKRPSCAQENE